MLNHKQTTTLSDEEYIYSFTARDYITKNYTKVQKIYKILNKMYFKNTLPNIRISFDPTVKGHSKAISVMSNDDDFYAVTDTNLTYSTHTLEDIDITITDDIFTLGLEKGVIKTHGYIFNTPKKIKASIIFAAAETLSGNDFLQILLHEMIHVFIETNLLLAEVEAETKNYGHGIIFNKIATHISNMLPDIEIGRYGNIDIQQIIKIAIIKFKRRNSDVSVFSYCLIDDKNANYTLIINNIIPIVERYAKSYNLTFNKDNPVEIFDVTKQELDDYNIERKNILHDYHNVSLFSSNNSRLEDLYYDKKRNTSITEELELYMTAIDSKLSNCNINESIYLEEKKKLDKPSKKESSTSSKSSSITLYQLRLFFATMLKMTKDAPLRHILDAAIKTLERLEKQGIPPPKIATIMAKSPTISKIISKK